MDIEKKKTFIELAREYNSVWDSCEDSETGEITIDAEKKLGEIQCAVSEKCDAIAHVCKDRIPAEIDMMKAVIDRARARIDALGKKRERMLAYAASFAELMEGGKHKGHYSIYRGSSERVEVDNVDALPSNYIRTTITREPDKARIHDEFRKGHSVPGARIVKSESWRVR